MRALDLVVDGLADVVEEAAAAGDFDVGAELVRDHRGEVRRLDGVLELVLAVAVRYFSRPRVRTISGCRPGTAGLDDRLFAGVLDRVVDFLAGLLDHLLDAGRVDAAVRQELRQRDAGDLAAHRVEAGERDGVRRVVDDEVDAGGQLEGADVAALAADDAALHVLGGERHDRDGGLGDDLGGEALHRRRDDLAGALVRLFLDLVARSRGRGGWPRRGSRSRPARAAWSRASPAVRLEMRSSSTLRRSSTSERRARAVFEVSFSRLARLFWRCSATAACGRGSLLSELRAAQSAEPPCGDP